MPDKNKPSAAAAFTELLQADRKKARAEQLAQDIFGKNRRQSAPAANAGKRPALGGSFASRVGVNKRNSSLPRTANDRPRNNPRQQSNLNDRARAPNVASPAPTGNGFGRANAGISIKGAAGGPSVVFAQNFAPGTTAADIESVMQSVISEMGGRVEYCRLVASDPTVIAEMAFTERAWADQVIETFNNKRADGRLLYVYMKDNTNTPIRGTARSAPPAPAPVELEPEPIAPVLDAPMDGMDIDEHTEARETQDRLREERHVGRDDGRGRDEHDRRDPYPVGPRNGGGYRSDYYDNRGPPRDEYRGSYGGRGGYGRGGGGGYRDDRGFGRGGGRGRW